jgi:hypothetical protein
MELASHHAHIVLVIVVENLESCTRDRMGTLGVVGDDLLGKLDAKDLGDVLVLVICPATVPGSHRKFRANHEHGAVPCDLSVDHLHQARDRGIHL